MKLKLRISSSSLLILLCIGTSHSERSSDYKTFASSANRERIAWLQILLALILTKFHSARQVYSRAKRFFGGTSAMTLRISEVEVREDVAGCVLRAR